MGTESKLPLVPLRVMQLNRLFTLLMLCAGLVLAGAPAIACCAESTLPRDCCPNAPEPTNTQSPGIEASTVVYGCCAGEVQTVTATTAIADPRQLDSDSTPADPPLSVTLLAALIAVHAPSAVNAVAATPLFVASQAPLYLRTGRLRL
jgi:hypothetical protein